MRSLLPHRKCELKTPICQYIFYVGVFLLGASLLSGLLNFQIFFLGSSYSLQPWEYLIPVLLGGTCGTFIGIVFLEIKKKNCLLTQSQSHLLNLIDNAFILTQSIDTAGIILNVNKTWEITLGYTKTEVIGKSIFEFIAEEDRTNYNAAMENALTGETARVQFTFLDKASEKVFVDGYTNCWFENGKPVSTHAVLKNSNTNHQREKMLKLSATVFEYTNDGIFVTDNNGHIIMANEAISNLTGYSKNDLLGITPINLISREENVKHILEDIYDAIQYRKPWQGEIISSAKNNNNFHAFLKLMPVKDDAGNSNHLIGVLNNITGKKEADKRLRYMATHDLLTSLPNRTLFIDRLQAVLWKAEQRGETFATLYIDLDGFKDINDTYGHGVGDSYLKAISNEVKKSISEKHMLARFGGDEFAVLLLDIHSELEAAFYAQEILNTISTPILIDSHSLRTTASIGICLYSDNQDPYYMLTRADAAMYRAKESGKNAFAFHRKDS